MKRTRGIGMEILIEDIPEEGLSIQASESERWLTESLRDALGEAFQDDGHAALDLRLLKVEQNVTLDGEIALTTHRPCDRCLVRFEEHSVVPLHAVLAPLYESRRQQEREEGLGVDVVREDLEFGFYEGDRIDLGDVIRENVLLDAPMQHICREDCAGLCPRCGRNLNEGACGCAAEEHKGSFEALKAIVLPKGKKQR